MHTQPDLRPKLALQRQNLGGPRLLQGPPPGRPRVRQRRQRVDHRPEHRRSRAPERDVLLQTQAGQQQEPGQGLRGRLPQQSRRWM